MWLVSGGIKAANPTQTYLAVHAYQVLPASVVSPVAAVLPLVEIGLGSLLLAGLGTRQVAALSGLLLLILMAGVAQAWVRGLTIDCGCFGGGGQVAADQTAYGLELARDTGFLLLAGWLLVRAGSYLGVDRVLAGRRSVRVAANEVLEGDVVVPMQAQAVQPDRIPGGERRPPLLRRRARRDLRWYRGRRRGARGVGGRRGAADPQPKLGAGGDPAGAAVGLGVGPGARRRRATSSPASAPWRATLR